MKGPKIKKKGHWEESKRDSRRDEFYRLAGFRVLKIWEHELKEETWQAKLKDFLQNCYTERIPRYGEGERRE